MRAICRAPDRFLRVSDAPAFTKEARDISVNCAGVTSTWINIIASASIRVSSDHFRDSDFVELISIRKGCSLLDFTSTPRITHVFRPQPVTIVTLFAFAADIALANVWVSSGVCALQRLHARSCDSQIGASRAEPIPVRLYYFERVKYRAAASGVIFKKICWLRTRPTSLVEAGRVQIVIGQYR
jgi:hypothetical protein